MSALVRRHWNLGDGDVVCGDSGDKRLYSTTARQKTQNSPSLGITLIQPQPGKQLSRSGPAWWKCGQEPTSGSQSSSLLEPPPAWTHGESPAGWVGTKATQGCTKESGWSLANPPGPSTQMMEEPRWKLATFIKYSFTRLPPPPRAGKK